GKRSSDRSTELVLGYYAAFNRGDWNGMCALLAEDVVHEVNQSGTERGRDAFATFLQRMQRSYREQLRDIVVMTTDDGCRASAEYIVEGEYLADDGPAGAAEGAAFPSARGQRYVLAGGAFFEIRGNRIVRITNYYNLA